MVKKIIFIGGFLCGSFLVYLFCTALAQQEQKEDELINCISRVMMRIREKVAPATVAIFVERTRDPEGGEGRPFGKEYHTAMFNRPKGPCTGTIVREDGYIATSAFNVSGTIKSISVQTHDGKRYKARILRRDRELDLALLKIDAKGLPVLKEGKPRKLRQGSFVAVIGRSPDPFRPTIVWGIVSARNRFRATTFQTDAKMNFGNVGGPVVDLDGKLLGIASHVKAQNRVRGRIAWVQSCGIGFATKIKFIRRWLRRYKKEEPEKPPKPPREY